MPKFHLIVAAMVLANGSLTFAFATVQLDDRVYSLEEIIAQIEMNEKLYQNLDVTVESKYEHQHKNGAGQDTILDRRSTFRFVQQGEFYKFTRNEVESTHRTGVMRPKFAVAYDGQQSRLMMTKQPRPGSKDKETVTSEVKAGRFELPVPFCPHTELMSILARGVPLSVWLRGGEDLKSHPKVDSMYRDGIINNRTTFLGRDTVNGLRCIKLCNEVILLETGAAGTVRHFWLAEDRNFIPVRMVGYSSSFSKDKKTAEAVVSELKEVEPDVWFPMKFHRDVYDAFFMKVRGEHVLGNVEDWQVKKITLNPKFEKAFFERIALPED